VAGNICFGRDRRMIFGAGHGYEGTAFKISLLSEGAPFGAPISFVRKSATKK
jgi:hypothetical protein